MDIVTLELRRAEHWQAREGTSLLDVCARLRAGEPLGEREAQLAAALERQEVLLFAALHVLLNMAEEPTVEAKMMRRGLLGHLVLLLDRAGTELLLLATTFLLRLSARPEGRVGMLEAGVAPRAAALLPTDSCELLRVQLHLMHNLALEPEGRLALVNAGMVGKVAVLLEGEGEGKQACAHHQLALSLLCQLSADDKHRSLFLYTGALPRLGALLLEAPPGGVAPELATLTANLTESPRVAEELARCGLVEPLLARALAERELSVWRLVHNLAAHESEDVRQRFMSSLPGIASLLMVRGRRSCCCSSPLDTHSTR